LLKVVGVGVGPLYNSALALMVGKSDPPAASTMPLDSKSAVWPSPGVVQATRRGPRPPLAASYSSALAKAKPCSHQIPPRLGFVPLDNRVAV